MQYLRGVIPVKAGIQFFQIVLDPGLRRGDDRGNEMVLKLMTSSENAV